MLVGVYLDKRRVSDTTESNEFKLAIKPKRCLVPGQVGHCEYSLAPARLSTEFTQYTVHMYTITVHQMFGIGLLLLMTVTHISVHFGAFLNVLRMMSTLNIAVIPDFGARLLKVQLNYIGTHNQYVATKHAKHNAYCIPTNCLVPDILTFFSFSSCKYLFMFDAGHFFK